jgi:hypothetical protein
MRWRRLRGVAASQTLLAEGDVEGGRPSSLPFAMDHKAVDRGVPVRAAAENAHGVLGTVGCTLCLRTVGWFVVCKNS